MENICNTPFFIDLQNEYFQHKETLDEWHRTNSYSVIHNSQPYPQSSLYSMIDILEIMDNMYSYSPCGDDYKQCACHFNSLVAFYCCEGHHQNVGNQINSNRSPEFLVEQHHQSQSIVWCESSMHF